MRLPSTLALLVGLVVGRVVQHLAAAIESIAEGLPTQITEDLHANFSRLVLNENAPVNKFVSGRPKFTEQQRKDIWCKAKSKGMSLSQASLLDEIEAREYLQWPYVKSPWDSDLKEGLKTWGYLDDDKNHDSFDSQCDFAEYHEMRNAFEGLNVDTRSAGMGGPNRCYNIKHRDGPAVLRDENGRFPQSIKDQIYRVDGKDYHSTDASATIGVNARDGIVYMLLRESPAKAAKVTWRPDPVTPDALPKLRSSPDLMYGLWHRETTEATKNEGDEIEAALALLGSPNGLAAGYFLIQHKLQLNWKYIWKVKIFESGGFPYILFYVSDRALWEGPIANIGTRLEKSQTKSRRKRSQGVRQKKSRKHKSVHGRHRPRL